VINKNQRNIKSIKLKNKILWQLNRFRNPERYQQFADSKKWIFIVGCNNSGTTLLEGLLSSHPDIASFPFEGQQISRTLPLPGLHGVARIWTEKLNLFRMTEANQDFDSVRLLHDWKNCLNDISASVILEKSPPRVSPGQIID